MRRLATLAVMAAVAAGCTKGGEAGPKGTDAVASISRAVSNSFAVTPPATGAFWGPTVTANVAAGQNAYLTYSLGVITQTAQQSVSLYLCYRTAGSSATPTQFPTSRSIVFYPTWVPGVAWYVESEAVHANFFTATVGGTYEFGLCGGSPTANIGWEGAEAVLMVLN